MFVEEFNETLKPEHHFVTHYPQTMRLMGPLICLWSMRFEGKHQFFKKNVQKTGDYKIIIKTLAERHQQYMAYCWNSNPLVFDVKKVPLQYLALEEYEYAVIVFDFTGYNISVYPTSWIKINFLYKYKFFVCIGKNNFGLPEFTEIIDILLLDNIPCFIVCKWKTVQFNEHLRYGLSAVINRHD